MSNSSKFYVSLASMALCATGLSQTHATGAQIGPKPIPLNRVPTRGPDPISYRKTMLVGNQIIYLTPPIPYVPTTRQTRKDGSLILDVYEGAYTSGGSGPPTELTGAGNYGENWGLGGGRYYFGSSFAAPVTASHYFNIFGNPGKNAVSQDFLVLCENSAASGYTNTSVQYVEFFTANDAFSYTSPTSFNSGIEWNFGSPGITPGSYYYFNLTAPSVPVVMPTVSAGWVVELFLNPTFTGTLSASTECLNSQATVWGTKPLNTSQVDGYWWTDGSFSLTGGSQNGTLNNLWLFEYDSYSSVASYTVTRGKEDLAYPPGGPFYDAGVGNVSNLVGNPNSDVVVLQKQQPTLTANQAEITAVLNLPGFSASSTMLRGIAVAKGNSAGPLNAKTATNMYFLNNTKTTANGGVAVYDTIRTISPIVATNTHENARWTAALGSSTDGSIILAATAGAKGLVAPQNGALITDYVKAGATPTVTMRLGMHQPAPASIGWTMQCNLMTVQYGSFGPSPLSPCLAFSAP